jgi:membrane-bound ClpP family serine protease
VTADDVVRKALAESLKLIEDHMMSDVFFYCGPIVYGTDKVIRDAVEAMQKRNKQLLFILETNGGYIEVVQRIADTLRRYFDVINFLVPDHALSAGTVLVMAGDSIWMDYYSVLGPIDPQLPDQKGGMLPALGYLKQYERFIAKSAKKALTTAEVAFLLEKFDPAELYKFERAKELSVSLLKEWLVKYKFKNWKKTQTRNIAVSEKMKKERAEQIARILLDTDRWNSHGRGISMAVLQNAIQLQIDDFGQDDILKTRIRNHCKLVQDYAGKMGKTSFLHTREAEFQILF